MFEYTPGQLIRYVTSVSIKHVFIVISTNNDYVTTIRFNFRDQQCEFGGFVITIKQHLYSHHDLLKNASI